MDMTPPKEMRDTGIEPHYHLNKIGMLEACYHRCRTLTKPGFWIGLTLGFPIEHALWDYVPPFSYVTRWLGL